jgi:hypothetical protein
MEPGSEIAAAYFHYDTAHGPVSSSSVLMSRKVFEANIADTADQNKVRTFLLETIYSSALNSERLFRLIQENAARSIHSFGECGSHFQYS